MCSVFAVFCFSLDMQGLAGDSNLEWPPETVSKSPTGPLHGWQLRDLKAGGVVSVTTCPSGRLQEPREGPDREQGGMESHEAQKPEL